MDDIRVFIFDHDIVAARSREEARQCMIDADGGPCGPDDYWPNQEVSLDTEACVDVDIDGKGCKCPRCGYEYTKVTFRQMIQGVAIPAIIGGRD